MNLYYEVSKVYQYDLQQVQDELKTFRSIFRNKKYKISKKKAIDTIVMLLKQEAELKCKINFYSNIGKRHARLLKKELN